MHDEFELTIGRSYRHVRSTATAAALIQAWIGPIFRPTIECMQILPISRLKDKLNEYVDAVAQTRDQITITKNGSAAAILIGIDEWEEIQETLHWLSQPNTLDSIAASEADIAAGRTYGEDEIRAAYNLPRRNS